MVAIAWRREAAINGGISVMKHQQHHGENIGNRNKAAAKISDNRAAQQRKWQYNQISSAAYGGGSIAKIIKLRNGVIEK